MGGYMTINMLLSYPNYFAAAYSASTYYPGHLLDEGKLNTLKDIPIWFAYCSNDDTVPPKSNSESLISGIKEHGGIVYSSVFSEIEDTTGRFVDEKGEPYIYYPHWAWVPVLNNMCQESGTTLWEFLAEQRLQDENAH
jgi:predicted peptidase